MIFVVSSLPPNNKFHFDAHAQNNSIDCGLYAIAYTTELVCGNDLCQAIFREAYMRQRILYFNHDLNKTTSY